jgi:hypothetical protein
MKQDDLSADITMKLPASETFIAMSVTSAIKGALLRLNDLGVSGKLVIHIELKPEQQS